MATRYPTVNSPAFSDDQPAARCTRPSATTSVPAEPLRRKFESVAPAKVLLLKMLRSTNGAAFLVSILKKVRMNTTKATSRPREAPENHPSLGPCEMKTLIASIATTKATSPDQSNRWCDAESAALESGVSLIRKSDARATAIEIQKIDRQPRKEAAISPPNSEQNPDPPHEPIDQNDSARSRASPS